MALLLLQGEVQVAMVCFTVHCSIKIALPAHAEKSIWGQYEGLPLAVAVLGNSRFAVLESLYHLGSSGAYVYHKTIQHMVAQFKLYIVAVLKIGNGGPKNAFKCVAFAGLQYAALLIPPASGRIQHQAATVFLHKHPAGATGHR
jgi:hypothetical protein